MWAIDAHGTGKAPVDQSVRLGAGASAGDVADAVWSAVAAEFPAQTAEPTPAPAPSAVEAASPPTAAGRRPAKDEPATPGDAAPTPSASAAAHPAAATRATSLAVLQVAMEGGLRHFSYVDRLTPSLRPYNLSFAPLFAIHGEVYPFAKMGVPVLSGFGATGSYARAFALSSKDAAGDHVGTTWQTFDIGARERLRLGDSVILGIDLGYGGDDFTFDTPVTATAQLPSAQYRTLRAGLDGRVALGALSARAAASYLDVLSTGDFGRLFPRTSVGGVEAELGLAYAIAPTFELSIDVAYTRFFYSLLPQPGDTYVAGGALESDGQGVPGFRPSVLRATGRFTMQPLPLTRIARPFSSARSSLCASDARATWKIQAASRSTARAQRAPTSRRRSSRRTARPPSATRRPRSSRASTSSRRTSSRGSSGCPPPAAPACSSTRRRRRRASSTRS